MTSNCLLTVSIILSKSQERTWLSNTEVNNWLLLWSYSTSIASVCPFNSIIWEVTFLASQRVTPPSADPETYCPGAKKVAQLTSR